jgi:Rieske 2Fe-2S family protein
VVLIPLSPRDLRAVLAPLDVAATLPPTAYTDPAVFDLELRALFGAGFYAASPEDLSGPGAWARAPLGDDRLVVAVDAEMEPRLLRDVCRHRAVALLDGDHGALPALSMTCPYHGWRYGLDGALRDAPGLCAGADRGALGLSAGSVRADGPQLRAARDGAADARWSSVPWLAGLPRSALRRARRVRWEVAANWKLLVENFQESHHFSRVHPWLEALTPWVASRSVTDGEAWLGGVMDLRADIETVSVSGRVDGRPRIAAASMGHRVWDAWLAPNLLTSLQPDYLLTYRLHPLGPARTEVVAEVRVHAEARDDASLDAVFAFWDRVNAEDRGICERQQRGLAAARGAGVYCASEDGAHAFDGWVARALLRAMGESP